MVDREPLRGPYGLNRGKPRNASSRPLAFLVSTTATATRIRDQLGSPAYSYAFVVDALAPVLERFGKVVRVDHPESRLSFAARAAEEAGYRPLHLSVNPLQDTYLAPGLPNILFPFWEFTEIPNRDFGTDTRQNWTRPANQAALILTACEFTADSFRTAKVRAPLAVVPIPLAPEAFNLPDWNPADRITLTCRHEYLGGSPSVTPPETLESPSSLPRGLAWRASRSLFRRVHPWLDPKLVGKLTRIKRGLADASRQPKSKLIFNTMRDGYRNHVRRWLSQEALERISSAKRRALAKLGIEPKIVLDPPLPTGAIELGGLVYLTIFNLGDFRKNYLDILTAYLDALKDHDDATLVIKLVTNRVREHHESGLLRSKYESTRWSRNHRCKVVVITEFLNDEQMDALFRVSTYYVNASHAEGACLPLMRALGGGRPAIAPAHTAMADYMDDQIGFVPSSSLEPAYWPHDPQQRLETHRYRIAWSELRDAFAESAGIAKDDPERYRRLADQARRRLQNLASRDAAAIALDNALNLLDDPQTPFGIAEESAPSRFAQK